MTTGHRHRVVRLPAGSRRLRALQRPLVATTDAGRAERSRWVWGRITGDDPTYPRRLRTGSPLRPDAFVLTPLSILHTLTGLTIETEAP